MEAGRRRRGGGQAEGLWEDVDGLEEETEEELEEEELEEEEDLEEEEEEELEEENEQNSDELDQGMSSCWRKRKLREVLI